VYHDYHCILIINTSLEYFHQCEPTCRCGYDVHACNLCDVKLNGGDTYEFSFDNVTQVTCTNVLHNLVEISTPASRFAPVILDTVKLFRVTLPLYIQARFCVILRDTDRMRLPIQLFRYSFGFEWPSFTIFRNLAT